MKLPIRYLPLLILPAFFVQAAELRPETDAEFAGRMAWFNEAKFGLFIHYGIYSTLEGSWKGKPQKKYAEWIQSTAKIHPDEYIPLAANFKPERLDADEWIRTAKAAGMRYMVITTKHHEGFCLWDSAETEYDLGEATTFNRDILGELSAACKKHGVTFGTYYSHTDWWHPTQRTDKGQWITPMRDKEEYVRYLKAQCKELIERYDTEIMWFDGDWVPWWTLEDGVDLYNYLRGLKPDIIINNRVAKRRQFKKDFGTPENSTPGAALDHAWEACWTINHSWGYKRHDTGWKDAETLIRKQIDINSKGGNLLLNVGPKADGSWPEACTERLLEMGQWNQVHSEAVYDAEYCELGIPDWGRITQKRGSDKNKGQLFAYVFDWPANGTLTLSGARFGNVRVTDYSGRQLPVKANKSGIQIDVSGVSHHPAATVLRVHYRDGMHILPTLDGLELTGNELILDAKDAKLTGRNIRLEGKNIGYWSDPDATATWQLNITAPGRYKVLLVYASGKGRDGSDVTLEVEGQTLTQKVKDTGEWSNYNIMELGDVRLTQVGTTPCTVGFGTTRKGPLLNLKTILFAPANE